VAEHEYRLTDDKLMNLFDDLDDLEEATNCEDLDALDAMLEEECGMAPRRRKPKN